MAGQAGEGSGRKVSGGSPGAISGVPSHAAIESWRPLIERAFSQHAVATAPISEVPIPMPIPLQPRLDVENIGDVPVAAFRDAKITDDQTTQAVREELFDLVQRGRKKIVLYFAAVQSLSSAARELLAV